MKHLLHILLFLIPILAFPQGTPQGINYQAVAYDNNGLEIANQEISIRLGILLESADAESSYSETHQITTNNFGLFSLLISQGNSTDDFSALNWENGAYLKVELDEDLDGEYVLMGVNSFSSVPYSLFAENIPSYYSDEIEGLVSEIGGLNNEIDSLESIVSVVSQYFGCKDHDACNYDATATMSDNTCIYATAGYYCDGECIDTDGDMVCDLNEVEGCTDATACNYVLGATNEDGSCEYNQQYYNCQGDCENDDDGDGTCDELEQGCTDETSDNFNPQALNNSTCIYSGCTDITSGNYNPMANQDDGSCIPAEACPYPEYLEYDSTAATFNASLCDILAVYGCMDYLALNYNPEANANEGCEHIYGCMDGMADNYNEQATSDDNSCIISGCTNTVAGNYNEFANTDDGSCLIGGCVFELAENYNAEAEINDGSCIVYGCVLENYPNYNLWATVDDGSCDMSSTDVFGCTDSIGYNYNPLANINNGDCLMIHPGELMEGGMVFYVDETGHNGLVASLQGLGGIWGCSGTNIPGASGTTIGAGLENTLAIVEGCDDFSTAAYKCLIDTTGGYTDWYLPSTGELTEMYYSIGNGSIQGNILGVTGAHWSSSSVWSNSAWMVWMNSHQISIYSKSNSFAVRPIRAF
jgi:hypothetical protein